MPLPLKSAGLLRAGARALRLIRPLLFVEISKTAAGQHGARVPCHSARHPPCSSCRLSLCWVPLCLPVLLSCCKTRFREEQGAARLEQAWASRCIPRGACQCKASPQLLWASHGVKHYWGGGKGAESAPLPHLFRKISMTHPLISHPPISNLLVLVSRT